MNDYGLSERRSCALVALARSSCRYTSRRDPALALRARLRSLAEQRRRFGYRRLTVLLRREGLCVNHKRVYRLYRAEGLAVRRRRRKRCARAVPAPLAPATRLNQRWAMDFMKDQLTTGRAFRIFNLIDEFSRKALASDVDTSLPGARVVQSLERAVDARGAPDELIIDNGPEFIGKALDAWAWARGVRLHFIDPGKPIQNAYIESFNGRFRDECLNDRGSRPWATHGTRSTRGGRTTIRSGPTARSAIARRTSSSSSPRTGHPSPHSHCRWTNIGGQVTVTPASALMNDIAYAGEAKCSGRAAAKKKTIRRAAMDMSTALTPPTWRIG